MVSNKKYFLSKKIVFTILFSLFFPKTSLCFVDTNNNSSVNQNIQMVDSNNNKFYFNSSRFTQITFSLVEKAKEASLSIIEYTKNNKIKVAITFGLAGYVWLNYRLIILKKELGNQKCWSLWLKELAPTLEKLLNIEQKELMEMMLKEIQHRYVSAINPSDFVGPMIAFNQEVQNERTKLEKYINTSGWLVTLNLSKLSFINEKFLHQCKARLQRLIYLKNIFTKHMVEYNLVRSQAVIQDT